MIDAWNRGDVPDRNAGRSAPRVVHDDIEVTEPLRGGIDERGDGVGVPHVGGHELGVTTSDGRDRRQGSWRPQIMTSAPRARNASVIPRPTPPAPPVTSTARPVMSSTSSTPEVVARGTAPVCGSAPVVGKIGGSPPVCPAPADRPLLHAREVLPSERS